jgi:hypothetical protein
VHQKSIELKPEINAAFGAGGNFLLMQYGKDVLEAVKKFIFLNDT